MYWVGKTKHKETTIHYDAHIVPLKDCHQSINDTSCWLMRFLVIFTFLYLRRILLKYIPNVIFIKLYIFVITDFNFYIYSIVYAYLD